MRAFFTARATLPDAADVPPAMLKEPPGLRIEFTHPNSGCVVSCDSWQEAAEFLAAWAKLPVPVAIEAKEKAS